MTTILIVDDHVLFRDGLKAIFRYWDDFQVLDDAENGEEAIRKVRDLMPDMVLMDVAMPVMDGITATQQIKREFPAVRVVIVTVSDESEDLFRALKAGASGYILKNTPSRRLHDLLRGVMHNETPLSGAVATKIVEEFSRPQVEKRCPDLLTEPLTEREQSILELLVGGLTNMEIAQRLYLSESTVKKYLHNVLEKLHLNNRVEAAAYAAREGLVKR
jgi:DNA-binding NarL/FixJ family response regulator